MDPGLKGTVYCTAIREGGVAEWDFAFRKYKTATVAAESARLLSALGCSSEPWILSRSVQRMACYVNRLLLVVLRTGWE